MRSPIAQMAGALAVQHISTKAREAYAWACAQYPRDHAAEAPLKAAADAELETDIPEMTKLADWLEGIADHHDADGKPFMAQENREAAARYRGIVAELEAPVLRRAA